MANTTSLAFPNMFDVSRNRVSVLQDTQSVVNRTRLLILTEPTELYMNPDFGVGMKKYLWQYNNDSIQAIIRDRIVEQLRINEPCVLPDDTELKDGLIFTGDNSAFQSMQDENRLKITVSLKTKFNADATIKLLRDEMFGPDWDKNLGGNT